MLELISNFDTIGKPSLGYSTWQNSDEIVVQIASNLPGDKVFVWKKGEEGKLAHVYDREEFIKLQTTNRLWLERNHPRYPILGEIEC